MTLLFIRIINYKGFIIFDIKTFILIKELRYTKEKSSITGILLTKVFNVIFATTFLGSSLLLTNIITLFICAFPITILQWIRIRIINCSFNKRLSIIRKFLLLLLNLGKSKKSVKVNLLSYNQINYSFPKIKNHIVINHLRKIILNKYNKSSVYNMNKLIILLFKALNIFNYFCTSSFF
jgi:hypothetical protein